MIIKADNGTYFVFDLDDTLYFEVDYLKSAFKSIASRIESGSYIQLYDEIFSIYKSGGDAFEYIIKNFPGQNYTKEYLLNLYRSHFPQIDLKEGVLEMLVKIKAKNGKIGIITNGRSITQRNKLKALGLEPFPDITIISEEIGFEKPNEMVYKDFLKKKSISQFYYFGDNLTNDFISPRKLGWCCIGIVNKNNITKIGITDVSQEYLPHLFIKEFSEIEII
jgi:putative hydrolase of the HAD superfamily